jgi:hypothetical protein
VGGWVGGGGGECVCVWGGTPAWGLAAMRGLKKYPPILFCAAMSPHNVQVHAGGSLEKYFQHEQRGPTY